MLLEMLVKLYEERWKSSTAVTIDISIDEKTFDDARHHVVAVPAQRLIQEQVASLTNIHRHVQLCSPL